MKKTHTRRSVLKGGLQTAIALGPASVIWTRGVESVWAEVASNAGEAAESTLAEMQRDWLSAVADELIPESGEMPCATAVGAVDYIDIILRDVAELHQNITQALNLLAQSSQKEFQTDLDLLTSDQRVKLLEAFETESKRSAGKGTATTDLFAILRDLVYEAYYTNPDVWSRIGYEFRKVEDGPRLKPFDEQLLAKVRTLPRNYREVQ